MPGPTIIGLTRKKSPIALAANRLRHQHTPFSGLPGADSQALTYALHTLSASARRLIEQECLKAPQMAEQLRQVGINLVLVVATAKESESEDLFNDAVGLLRHVDLSAFAGGAAKFAISFLQLQKAQIEKETEPADGPVPQHVILGRLGQLEQFIEHCIAIPRTSA